MNDRSAIRLAAVLGIVALAASAPRPPGRAAREQPRVLADIPVIGTQGGELRTLIGRARDTRLLHVYGYARLVTYDLDLELVPDILLDYQVEEGRIFTFHLRKGHAWSDGKPFTTDDFRFWWEDVAQVPELMPSGPPIQLIVDGELPKVEIIDETTIRYSWSKPNPFFLPSLAGAAPITLACRPTT